MTKEILMYIFQLKFIHNCSLRRISNELGIHRNTVTKYVGLMERNIAFLEMTLSDREKPVENISKEFILSNWEEYIDIIIFYENHRKKRKLLPEVVDKIASLSNQLETTSAIKIYRYIHENSSDRTLVHLSYSSIWRSLQEIKKS